MKIQELKYIFKDNYSLEQILINLKNNISSGKKNNNLYNDDNKDDYLKNEYDINNSSEINNENNERSIENTFRNYINDNKDNEEITMDKKYDFLFKNKK